MNYENLLLSSDEGGINDILDLLYFGVLSEKIAQTPKLEEFE